MKSVVQSLLAALQLCSGRKHENDLEIILFIAHCLTGQKFPEVSQGREFFELFIWSRFDEVEVSGAFCPSPRSSDTFSGVYMCKLNGEQAVKKVRGKHAWKSWKSP